MKKSKLIALAGILCIGAFNITTISSRPDGAPEPATGGPAESGATCVQGGCHGGSVTNNATYMSADIPVAGYTPGTTYNITVNMPSSGKKGFMFSAQDAAGMFMGTPISGTSSKVVFTHYITHTSAKSSNPGVWSFQWTAPAKGSGAVNLHGMFAIGTMNTAKQVITVQENTLSGVTELAEQLKLNSYVAEGRLDVKFTLGTQAHTSLKLMNLAGQTCAELQPGVLPSGEQHLSLPVAALNSGVYVLHINVNGQQAVQKVLISQ